MTVDEQEQLRANIWDYIYSSGPQSVEQLAEQLEISPQTVSGLVDHAWFSSQDDLVTIATEG